jgi:hypothetical protein
MHAVEARHAFEIRQSIGHDFSESEMLFSFDNGLEI